MYKQAAQMKLRFNTEKGMLTTEQLWDCTRAMLSRTIKKVHDVLKESEVVGELDFLSTDKVETADPVNTLRFNILKDVYMTKKLEAEHGLAAAKIKAHNQKIDELIAKKQDESLEAKSIAELEALRK